MQKFSENNESGANDIAVGSGGLQFVSQARQVGHYVANGLSLSVNGTVWRTSRQVYSLCLWKGT